MKTDPAKEYAVLTGDIVASSALPKADRRRLAEAIRGAGRRVVARFPDAVPELPDIFRGDSWQMLVTDPALTVRLALIMRLSIRAALPPREADSRVSIGIGLLDFCQKKDQGRRQRSFSAVRARSGGNRRAKSTLEHQAGGRTERRCLASHSGGARRVDGALDQKTIRPGGARLESLKQEEVAASTLPPISQPTAARQLRAAGLEGVEQALAWIEVSKSGLL